MSTASASRPDPAPAPASPLVSLPLSARSVMYQMAAVRLPNDHILFTFGLAHSTLFTVQLPLGGWNFDIFAKYVGVGNLLSATDLLAGWLASRALVGLPTDLLSLPGFCFRQIDQRAGETGVAAAELPQWGEAWLEPVRTLHAALFPA